MLYLMCTFRSVHRIFVLLIFTMRFKNNGLSTDNIVCACRVIPWYNSHRSKTLEWEYIYHQIVNLRGQSINNFPSFLKNIKKKNIPSPDLLLSEI